MLNLRKQNMKCLIAEMPIGDPFGGAAFGQRNDPIFSLPIAAQALIGGVAANIVGNAMTPKASPQAPAPAVTPPTAMPSPGDAAAKAAERASIAEQLRRRGRASTVLTDQGSGTTDKLGA